MLTTSDLRPGAVVTIDGLLTVRAAFLSFEHWNGWECPYLDRAATESLARQVTAAPAGDGMGTMALVGDVLTFASEDVPEEPEVDEGLLIDGIRYWTPGAWSWIWSVWSEDDGHRIVDTPEGVIVCERCGLPASKAYGDPCHATGRDRYTDRQQVGPYSSAPSLFAEAVQPGDRIAVPDPATGEAVPVRVTSTRAARYTGTGRVEFSVRADRPSMRVDDDVWRLEADPAELFVIVGERA